MVKNKYRKPHRVKRKKPIFKKDYFWVSLAIVLIGIELVFLVCFCSFFKVRQIKVEGNEKISEQSLSSFTWEKIEKNLLAWPSKSILLASTGQLKNNLKERYPYISEIKINRSFPDALNITIKERVPNFIWCVKDNCFKTDKDGIIFDKIQKNKELDLIIDATKNKPLALGEKVIEKEKLENIFRIKDEVEKHNVQISAFIIKEDRLVAKTKKEWEIYFDLEKDIDWQLTKLKADLEREIPKKRRKDLEYIELRFGNFAPYKYKEGSDLD